MTDHPLFQKKTSHDEILEVLTEIVKENLEEDKILVSVNSLVSHFKIKKDLHITDTTLRRYGINPDGYFVKKYPRVFGYKTDGRSKRGLVIDVEKFFEEFPEEFDREELVEAGVNE